MKYKFTGETKVVLNVTFKRIQAIVAFGIIAKGELGGWIEKEKNLSQVSGNAWVYDALLIAMRSDHYQFTVFPDKDGYTLLTAGCRGPWTLEEAIAYWKKTRKGTLLGKESIAIIAAFKVQAKIRGWKIR